MSRNFEHGFAIIRIEHLGEPGGIVPQSMVLEEVDDALGHTFTPVRVLWSRASALSEAERLNALNRSKGCRYYVVHTRVEPKPKC